MIILAAYLTLLFLRTAVAADAVPLAQLLKQPAVVTEIDALTHSQETLNHVEVIHPSAESLRLRLKLVRDSSAFTFITMPYWYNDKSGAAVIDALVDKSNLEKDFEYRVIQDWISPFYSKGGRAVYRRLSPNVVLWNSPLWQRRFSLNLFNGHVHDKYFIVDGTKMIIGSTNINDEHLQGGETAKGWHDTDIYVEGPAVRLATANYIKIWQLSKYLASDQPFPPFRDQEIAAFESYFHDNQEDHDFTTVRTQQKSGESFTETHHVHIELKKYLNDLKYFPPLPTNVPYTTPLRVIYDNALIDRDPHTKRPYSNIRRAVEYLLSRAQKSAWFYVPYLTLDKNFCDFLAKEARRIDIHIVTNSAETYDVTKKAYRGQLSHYEALMNGGVKIYEWQGNSALFQLRKNGLQLTHNHWPGQTLHTKMVLIDNEVVGIGSENFNNQSFNHNSEELAVINDAAVASRVADIFYEDMHPETRGWPIEFIKPIDTKQLQELKSRFKISRPIWNYPLGT